MRRGQLSDQSSDGIGHDEYVESKLLSSCNSCKEDWQTVAAVRYCVDCEEYQCSKCFKSHDRYNNGHEVYDASSRQKWGTKKQVKLPKERCPTHVSEVLQLYCEDHAALCCHVCIAMEHSRCRRRQYIPEVAKNITKQNEEFVTLSDTLDKMQTQIQKVIDDSKQNKVSITKSRLKFRQQLQEARRKFEALYNQLEQKSYAELHQSHDTIDAEADNYIQSSIALLAEINGLRERVNPDTHTNDSQLYINMKQVRGESTDMMKKVEIVSQPQSIGIECKTNPQVSRFLEITEGLLSSQRTSSQLNPTNILSYIPNGQSLGRVSNWMLQKWRK